MANDQPQRDRNTELLLLTVVFIWASNFPVAKWAIGGLGIYLFNGVRYIVAGALLAGISFARSPWKPIERGDWGKLILLGFLANVLYQVAFIIGLNMTTAGNSAVIISTAPLWTVLIHALIHKESIKPFTWVGTIISLIGIVLIIIGSGKKLEFGSDALYGDLVTLISALLWGVSTNLQKPLLTRYSPLQLNLISVLVGSVGLTLIAIPAATTTDFASIGWLYYVAAFASGALSTGIANVFWSNGVKKFGPNRTANFANLVPVIAFAISALLLDEHVFLIQIAGAAITISGVWLARR